MQTEQLLRQTFADAMAQPDGLAKLMALDTAIRQADAAGNEKLAFEFRHDSIQVFVFNGDDQRAFLAFSLSLAAYDRDPSIAGEGADHSILWQFKWIVNALPEFPDVPLHRIEAVRNDMRQRYLRGGHSLHAVHQARWQIALQVGEKDQAAEAYHDMVTAKRDSLSNCSICVPSAQAWYLGQLGRFDEAITVGKPAENGYCRQQPQRVQSHLMLPYLHTGRSAEAIGAHLASYRRMRTSRTYLSGIGLHLSFLGASGNETRGLELIERHLPWLDISPSPAATLRFAVGAAFVLRRLSDSGHGALVVRGRPDRLGPRPDTTVDELRHSLTRTAEELAARFDARNQTTYQSELARRQMSAEPVATLSLSVLDSTVVGRPKKVRRLQEQIVEHTRRGDLAAAALARLAAAQALRGHRKGEDAYAAAEEAALALERLSMHGPLQVARHLLWDLYRMDYRYRDSALAVVESLLREPDLPDTLPSKAQLLEQSAHLYHGAEQANRLIEAADLYHADGNRLGELVALRKAVRLAVYDADLPGHDWLARAEAIPVGDGIADERARLDLAAAHLLQREERWAEAVVRADAVMRHFADACDTFAEAESAGPANDAAEAGAYTYYHAAVSAIRVMLRINRLDEAERRTEDLITRGPGERHPRILLAMNYQAQGRQAEANAIIDEYDIDDWELDDDNYDDDYVD